MSIFACGAFGLWFLPTYQGKAQVSAHHKEKKHPSGQVVKQYSTNEPKIGGLLTDTVAYNSPRGLLLSTSLFRPHKWAPYPTKG